MKFVEAFNSLGYEIPVPRQDWSAEKPDGICLTLWTKETDWKTRTMNTLVHAGPLDGWRDKPGNRKRIRHIQRALAEFDGWVDVVKLDGEPGVSYGFASPWIPSERDSLKWRVTRFDPETGHYCLQAISPI